MDPIAPDPSTSPTRPPRRWLRRILVSIGVLLLLCLFAGLWIGFSTSRKWKDFAAQHDARMARVVARTGAREPLGGPAVPGNAWDDYEPALKKLSEARKARRSSSVMNDALRKPGDAALAAKAREASAIAAEPLAAVRAGTRRATAKYAMKWEQGFAADLPGLLSLQEAAQFLQWSARERLAVGDVDGALDEITALFQVGLDTANAPTLLSAMIGLAVIKYGADEAKAVLARPDLVPAAAERTLRLLKAADSQLPGFGSTMDSEMAWSCNSLKLMVDGKVDSDDSTPGGRWGTWVMVGQGGHAFHEVAETAARGDSMDYPSAAKLYRDTVDRLLDTWNPFVKLMLPGFAHASAVFRERQGHLRLLEAAALLKLGRGVAGPAWPVDPFTLKPLLLQEKDGKRALRCLGRDGVENPGGGWDANTKEEDLVLELAAP